jgi:uncharacterized NAD(P)/FAD-binding protein YdhS
MKSKFSVAVVGGGSVGVSYFYQLVDEVVRNRIAEHLEIKFFEPQSVVGPGFAYQPDFDTNLLNTRADSMSAVATDKQHFRRWLSDNASDLKTDYPNLRFSSDEFLPRSLFGRYLKDLFQDAVSKTKQHGIDFSLVNESVIDIIQLAGEKVCVDTGKSGYIADRVVLCLGNPPSTKYHHLQSYDGFVNNPYPTARMLSNIPERASVCVLGTGLSAIDAVLSLVEAGHKGRIVMASRAGRLPSVRGVHNTTRTLRLLSRDRLQEIAAQRDNISLAQIYAMLCAEVEAATGTPCNVAEILNANTGTFDYLSTEIQRSDDSERIWQSVIYATNNVIDLIWNLLSVEDKRLFQASFGSQWSSYRVSFPLKNARKLHELLRKDRILVLGGVKSCRFNEASGTFETCVRDSDRGFNTTIESQYLINATGFSTDVQNAEHPLIQNLLRRGLAVPDEFGGFSLEFASGTLKVPHRSVRSPIAVLGSLAAGTYFWTNAMDVNARLALNQVNDLVFALKHRIDTKPEWGPSQPTLSSAAQ